MFQWSNSTILCYAEQGDEQRNTLPKLQKDAMVIEPLLNVRHYRRRYNQKHPTAHDIQTINEGSQPHNPIILTQTTN